MYNVHYSYINIICFILYDICNMYVISCICSTKHNLYHVCYIKTEFLVSIVSPLILYNLV